MAGSLWITQNLVLPSSRKLFVDPDYAYLFNGFTLLQGISPLHVDHPGTPLQALNAINIGVINTLQNNQINFHYWSDLVASNPQIYLLNVSVLFLLLQVTGVWFLGFTLARYLPLFYGITAQATCGYFITSNFRENLLRNTPEGLTFTLLLWATILLIPVSFRLSDKVSNNLITPISLLVGIAAATKINVWAIAIIVPLFFKKLSLVVVSYIIILTTVLVMWIPIFPRLRIATSFWLGSSEGRLRSSSEFTSSVVQALFHAPWPALLALVISVIFLSVYAFSLITKQYMFEKIEGLNGVGISTVIILLSLILLSSMFLASLRNAYWFVPAIPFMSLSIALGLGGISRFKVISPAKVNRGY